MSCQTTRHLALSRKTEFNFKVRRNESRMYQTAQRAASVNVARCGKNLLRFMTVPFWMFEIKGIGIPNPGSLLPRCLFTGSKA